MNSDWWCIKFFSVITTRPSSKKERKIDRLVIKRVFTSIPIVVVMVADGGNWTYPTENGQPEDDDSKLHIPRRTGAS